MKITKPVLKRKLKEAGRAIGLEVSLHRPRGKESLPKYIEPEFRELYLKYCHKTMVPWSGLYTAYKAAKHIAKHKIPGAIVECGVWKGGCSALMAETLIKQGETGREIYLYDTFAGMTAPEDIDQHFTESRDSHKLYSDNKKSDHVDWCYGPYEEVQATLKTSGYPEEKIHMIKGPVEETLQKTLPENIALLRLDTDWYESTKAEMEHLYPLLSTGGMFLVDDYGTWQGARRAVDEYIEKHNLPLFLHFDPAFGGISAVKT